MTSPLAITESNRSIQASLRPRTVEVSGAVLAGRHLVCRFVPNYAQVTSSLVLLTNNECRPNSTFVEERVIEQRDAL